jgi:ligand-binding sensor domain-containing protein
MLLISYKIRLGCFLFFLLFPFSSFAQNNSQYSFNFPFKHIEHLDATQGLFGNEVHWMLQDKKGFMWFITDGALNRYDGYTFRTYSYDARDSNSITAGTFYGLAEDKNGTLWFPSLEQGLYSFDPSLEKFMRYRHKEGVYNSLLHDRMGPIAIQNDGMIWLTTVDGLDKFDPHSKSFTHFYKGKHGFTNDLFFTIIIDEQNKGVDKQINLWIVNNSPGIDQFDTKTGKLIKHFPFPFQNTGVWDPSRFTLRGIRNKTIWMGSNDKGIYGFDIEKQEYVFIKNDHHCNLKIIWMICIMLWKMTREIYGRPITIMN